MQARDFFHRRQGLPLLLASVVSPRLLLRWASLFYLALLAAALGWQSLRPQGLGLLWASPVDRAVPWWVASICVSWLLVLGPAWLEDKLPALRELSSLLYRSVQPITTWRIVVLAGLSGLCEEALFRGPLQSAIGWLPTALLFALAHGGGQRRLWVWFVFALAAGLLFGGLVELYGSVHPAIVAHITVNAINMRQLERHAPRPPLQPPRGPRREP